MVLGIALGLLIIGFAAAAGLAATISNSEVLYQTLRFGGVAYLLWLAYEEWRDADGDLSAVREKEQSRLSYFQHGLVVNILNPKAGVFYVTILPNFINPDDIVLPQAITLTLISVAIATIAHVLIVLFASLLRPLLDNPKRKRLVRRTLSGMLAAIALWFGITS